MLTLSHAAGANEPAVRDITLGELLQWAAETTPDRLALIAGVPDKANRRQWTYAELYAQSVRVAWALRARFEPGERVAIWAHNIPEWIMVEFGAAMAGVILVTVNPAFRSNEVPGVAVMVEKAQGTKCARSWKILPTVGEDAEYPDVSPRDAQALREWKALGVTV